MTTFEDLLAMIAGHEHGASLELRLEPDETGIVFLHLSASSRRPDGKRVGMSWAMSRHDRGRVAPYLEHVATEVRRAFVRENGRPFTAMADDLVRLSEEGLLSMCQPAKKLVREVLAAREGASGAVMATTHERTQWMLREVAKIAPVQEETCGGALSGGLRRVVLPGGRSVFAITRPDHARGSTLAALWADEGVHTHDLDGVVPALAVGKLIR